MKRSATERKLKPRLTSSFFVCSSDSPNGFEIDIVIHGNIFVEMVPAPNSNIKYLIWNNELPHCSVGSTVSWPGFSMFNFRFEFWIWKFILGMKQSAIRIDSSLITVNYSELVSVCVAKWHRMNDEPMYWSFRSNKQHTTRNGKVGNWPVMKRRTRETKDQLWFANTSGRWTVKWMASQLILLVLFFCIWLMVRSAAAIW